jgi:hypothetical protein
MNDVHLVEGSQSVGHLPSKSTYLLLTEPRLRFMATMHHLLEVSFLCPLHHQIKLLILYERLLIRYDVGMMDFGKHTNLIEAVIFVTSEHMTQFHLFESI